jgi:hypothetical protein
VIGEASGGGEANQSQSNVCPKFLSNLSNILLNFLESGRRRPIPLPISVILRVGNRAGKILTRLLEKGSELMKRIKVILVVVAAVATMIVLSAPAMAHDSFSSGNGVSQSFEIDHISSGGSGGGSTGNVANEQGVVLDNADVGDIVFEG